MDNVIWMAAYSYIHNSEKVVNAAKEMIVENFPQVIKKPDWKDFMKSHTDVLADILEKLATKHWSKFGPILSIRNARW